MVDPLNTEAEPGDLASLAGVAYKRLPISRTALNVQRPDSH